MKNWYDEVNEKKQNVVEEVNCCVAGGTEQATWTLNYNRFDKNKPFEKRNFCAARKKKVLKIFSIFFLHNLFSLPLLSPSPPLPPINSFTNFACFFFLLLLFPVVFYVSSFVCTEMVCWSSGNFTSNYNKTGEEKKTVFSPSSSCPFIAFICFLLFFVDGFVICMFFLVVFFCSLTFIILYSTLYTLIIIFKSQKQKKKRGEEKTDKNKTKSIFCSYKWCIV